MSKFSDKIRSVRTQLGKLFKPSLAFARTVLIASAVVTVPLIAFRQVGMLESAELSAYDMMLRMRPDESPDPRLLIVGVTESDIQRLQQWPISDGKIAEILQKLEAMQPRVIGLDILRDVPLGEGRSELTALLQKSERIIGVCLVTDGSTDNPGSPPPPGIAKDSFGFADFSVDPGGILRRALLFMKPPAVDVNPSEKHPCNDSSEVLFSFNLRLVLRYLQGEGINPKLDANQSLWLGSTQIKRLEDNEGGYKNADVRGYQVLINYRSRRQPANQVRLTDVLEGKIDPNSVKDKIVLIGYTTESVKDLFYTPYSAGKQKNQFMPGIVAHAQVVSQLLSAVLDKRPLFWFWPEWAEILWISAWSIVGGLLAWRIAHPTRLALAYLAMLGVCCGLSFGIFLLGGWLPAVAPSLALIVTGSSIVAADRFNQSAYGKAITAKVKQVFKIEIDMGQVHEEVAKLEETEAFKKAQQIGTKKRSEKQEESQTEPERILEITDSYSEGQNAVESLLTEPSQTESEQIPKITSNSSEARNAVESLVTELAQIKPHQIPEITNNSSNGLIESQTAPQQILDITDSSPEAQNAESPPDDFLAQLQQTAKQQKQRATARSSANSPIDVPPAETSSDYELSHLSQMQAKARQMRERRNAEKTIENQKTEDLKEI